MRISRITSDICFQHNKAYWLSREHTMMGSKDDIDFWCDRLLNNLRYFEHLITRCADEKNYYKHRLYWMMDHMIVANPIWSRIYHKELLSIFIDCNDMSVVRSVTRAILVNPMVYIHEPYFLDRCASLCVDRSIPVAVRCNALTLFTQGVVHIPELAGELEWMLGLMGEENSPAIRARIRMSVSLLKKSKQRVNNKSFEL
ncbi:hypothetical protein K5X82_11225 [Halosquirtibacter xylanolyticus]|uniref:hypothetical protein n=1 Tax=Halosquirtibacter xylanolyticus TaxID=3374599 RepID=UPI0037483A4C|nr:hypothetical protein K5X82_11225 [Prolixibacteraceae bacterium]